MKKQNKKPGKDKTDPYNIENVNDFLFKKYFVTSSNECTGLIPSNPESKQQKDNYNDIYDIN